VKKTQGHARTRITDIGAVGRGLVEERIGMVVGGMMIREGKHQVCTATLTVDGGMDVQTDWVT